MLKPQFVMGNCCFSNHHWRVIAYRIQRGQGISEKKLYKPAHIYQLQNTRPTIDIRNEYVRYDILYSLNIWKTGNDGFCYLVTTSMLPGWSFNRLVITCGDTRICHLAIIGIRRSHDRVIFIMEISIPGNTVFILRREPDFWVDSSDLTRKYKVFSISHNNYCFVTFRATSPLQWG